MQSNYFEGYVLDEIIPLQSSVVELMLDKRFLTEVISGSPRRKTQTSYMGA
jgi:hypothetical protein